MAWQFSIDVGGTFTDCIGRGPDGTVRRHKLLSSGVTQGAVAAEGRGANFFCDPRRTADPPDFWRGFRIRLLDADGNETGATRVAQFDNESGRFELEGTSATATYATRYELECELAAPVVAIRYVLGLGLEQPLPAVDVRLGTTRGTNALLTRNGAATAFVTTKGFGDLLHIRDQQRPKLFELNIQRAPPVFQSVLEVDERVAADGKVLQSLNIAATLPELKQLRDKGVDALAVCLLHAYAHPQHEIQIADIARDLGFADISLSHQVAPLRKIVPRADTTVVNAYLNPVLTDYRQQIESALGEQSRVRWMTSAGGLVAGNTFCGKESVLSGPAGGVVGFSRTATAAGFARTIGFDMGGTSTDVARFDGECARVYETQKAGVHLTTPMLEIETVAAGGGSICDFDGVQITVGPASAGADPGPACYGRGGPLTVTDMNLMLGRIREDRFPFPLDRAAVVSQLEQLCSRILAATGQEYTPQSLAAGMLKLANAKMASAIQSISTAKGYDPREYALVSFGGAAPQHACAVARDLGIRNILNHPDAGILSAVGIGLAPVIRYADRGIYQSWSECGDSLAATIETLKQQATAKFDSDTTADNQNLTYEINIDTRYVGQDATLSIDAHNLASMNELPARFHDLHATRYGYAHPDRELEVAAIHVIAQIESTEIQFIADSRAKKRDAIATASTPAVFNDKEYDTAIYERRLLQTGDLINGPAIISESLSTTVIEPRWQARVLSDGQLLITDKTGGQSNEKTKAVESLDPITLEVFANAFAGIADQMGQTLRNTATSVNVKERLDFSCAIFNTDGDLIVNAPHVPVHLGAMSETIRHLIADHPEMSPGDVFVTNDPYRGGSHLPDVTVITPVFISTKNSENAERLFFTASRAHHAEIGGIVPGSMPPFSKCLAEEGILLTSRHVVAEGVSQLDELRETLLTPPFPSRNVENNLADIAAQIAANHQGATRLLELTNNHETANVLTAMRQLLSVAEAKTRRALRRIGDGEFRFEDQLDDGSPIAVRIAIQDGHAEIDFSECADVHPENLNANRGIVQAAVIYVLRCLINEELPINQGILRAVDIKTPSGILNPPDHGDASRNAAMVGGNVETSQRIVDVLLGALDISAASQGTMNNLLFGNETFGYYETICGGAGATSDAAGASAVHTHMTNTRLTDPEVLESRFPVRLHQFRIRTGSGGNGQHRGGDGIVRQIEFLAPLSLSLLTQRRTTPPYGMYGGDSGSTGENHLSRVNGTEEQLPSRVQLSVQPGDTLTIKTPGGGGWGTPS